MIMLLVGVTCGIVVGIVLTIYQVLKGVAKSGYKIEILDNPEGGYKINIYPKEGD